MVRVPAGVGETAAVPPARVISYDQVVRAARRLFLATGTVDMDVLADGLAVSRATLYRVVRGRDRLLGDAIWTVGERSMREAVAGAPGTGIDRLVTAAERHLRELTGWKPLLTFVADEPAVAQRVLFLPPGRVHERSVALWSELLEDAERTGELVLPYPAGDAAHLVVTVTESVVYADLFQGREPDLELATRAQRALLRGP